MKRLALVALTVIVVVKGWHLIEQELDVGEWVDDAIAGLEQRLRAETLMDEIDRRLGRGD